MLDRVQGSNGIGYFSQAVADYAKNRKPENGRKNPKTIEEFSEKEWEKLLDKVDRAILDDRDEVEHRSAEAADKKKEQVEHYILGSSAKAVEELEHLLFHGTSAKSRHMMETGTEEEIGEPKNPDIQDSIKDSVSDELIQKLLGRDHQAPYSAMAGENGVVIYNGVSFQCDYENNRICLGDVSNLKDCISVSLEEGGCLVFNRDSIDQLSRAIGMFSPEDINRIMRAIAQDAKLRQTQMQIEDEASGVEVLKDPEKEKGAERPQGFREEERENEWKE